MFKDDKLKGLTIVGAGDIVVNTLLPTIKKYNLISLENVLVVTDKNTDLCKNIKDVPIYADTIHKNRINRIISENNPVWIASPSYAHLKYIQDLICEDLNIAIEKPLTSIDKEIEIVEKLSLLPQWNKVFCLSYYFIEKALPLMMLFYPDENYIEYITKIESNCNEQKIDISEIIDIRQNLGSLKKYSIFFLEGFDKRNWVLLKKNGGQIFETFIHLSLLTKMFVRDITKIDFDYFTFGKYNGFNIDLKLVDPTYIELHTSCNSVDVDIVFGKYLPNQLLNKIILASFENGVLSYDLKKRFCKVKLHNGTTHIIKVKDYSNYFIQFDLFRRFCRNDFKNLKFDGFINQIEILYWLSKLRKHTYECKTYDNLVGESKFPGIRLSEINKSISGFFA